MIRSTPTEQKEEQTYDAKTFREVVQKDVQEYIKSCDESALVELYNSISDNEAIYNEESSSILLKTEETKEIIADAEKLEQEVIAEKEKAKESKYKDNQTELDNYYEKLDSISGSIEEQTKKIENSKMDLEKEMKQKLDDVEKKIAEKMGFRASSDDRYRVLEMHVDLDLDEYVLPRPTKEGDLTEKNVKVNIVPGPDGKLYVKENDTWRKI